MKNNYSSHTRQFKTVENSVQCLLNYELIWLGNAMHITESELPDRFYSLESIPNTNVPQALVYIICVSKKTESCINYPNYAVLAYWNTQVRSTPLL